MDKDRKKEISDHMAESIRFDIDSEGRDMLTDVSSPIVFLDEGGGLFHRGHISLIAGSTQGVGTSRLAHRLADAACRGNCEWLPGTRTNRPCRTHIVYSGQPKENYANLYGWQDSSRVVPSFQVLCFWNQACLRELEKEIISNEIELLILDSSLPRDQYEARELLRIIDLPSIPAVVVVSNHGHHFLSYAATLVLQMNLNPDTTREVCIAKSKKQPVGRTWQVAWSSTTNNFEPVDK